MGLFSPPRINYRNRDTVSAQELALSFESLTQQLNSVFQRIGYEVTSSGVRLKVNVQALPRSAIDAKTITGTIIAGQIFKAAQKATTSCVFSSTDYNTVAWTAGNLVFADGKIFAISAGNTGNMTGGSVYFIYWSEESSWMFQTTTDYLVAAREENVFIANAWAAPTSDLGAHFVAINNPLHLNVNQISCNYLSALSADMGDLTSGTVTLTGAGAYLRMGATPPTSATAGTGMWTDYTGIYCLKSNVQTVFIDAVNGGIKLKTPTAVAGKYIDIGVGTADELQFFEGGVSKVRVGSNVFGDDEAGIYVAGDIVATEVLATLGDLVIGDDLTYSGRIILNNATNEYTTVITAPNVASSSKILTCPNVTGMFITTGNLSSITATGALASGSIAAGFTAIDDARLATISTGGKVSGMAMTSGDVSTSGYLGSTHAAVAANTTRSCLTAKGLTFQQVASQETNAGTIDYGTIVASQLSIIGYGSLATNRLVRIYDALGVGAPPSTSYSLNSGALNATSYYVGGVAGLNGTRTVLDSGTNPQTVTISNGIITGWTE